MCKPVSKISSHTHQSCLLPPQNFRLPLPHIDFKISDRGGGEGVQTILKIVRLLPPTFSSKSHMCGISPPESLPLPQIWVGIFIYGGVGEWVVVGGGVLVVVEFLFSIETDTTLNLIFGELEYSTQIGSRKSCALLDAHICISASYFSYFLSIGRKIYRNTPRTSPWAISRFWTHYLDYLIGPWAIKRGFLWWCFSTVD